MIRLARLAPVVFVGILAAPLAAQEIRSDSQELRVVAAAQPACVVGDAGARSASNAAFTADGRGGGAIVIPQLVDPQTAEPRASEIELSLPVICNAAHRLVIASGSGGLVREGGVPTRRAARDQFGDMLPYAITYDWAGATAASTSDRGFDQQVQKAAQGDLTVRIATPAGGGFLTAGRYSDTIIIRLEPGN